MVLPFFARTVRIVAFTLIGLNLPFRGAQSEQAGGARQLADWPAVAWPSGPLEVITAFEKPIEPERARTLVGQKIAYHDLAGPGKNQAAAKTPAGSLRIVGVKSADGGRTLVLATDAHPRI